MVEAVDAAARAVREAYLGVLDCRAPACPRSCQTISVVWASPVAPVGWPLEMSPPLGFTGFRPPISVAPSSSSLGLHPGRRSPTPRNRVARRC